MRNDVEMSVGSIRRCMFDGCVGDVDGFAVGMWTVELCGVRDGHSYVEGFSGRQGDSDVAIFVRCVVYGLGCYIHT